MIKYIINLAKAKFSHHKNFKSKFSYQFTKVWCYGIHDYAYMTLHFCNSVQQELKLLQPCRVKLDPVYTYFITSNFPRQFATKTRTGLVLN